MRGSLLRRGGRLFICLLFAEFDGEDLAGYGFVGDFGVLYGGLHVFDAGAGFDIAFGLVVGGGEDDLVVVVGVERGLFACGRVDGEGEDGGVGAADVAENSFDGVLWSFGVFCGVVGFVFGHAGDLAVDFAEDDRLGGVVDAVERGCGLISRLGSGP